MDRESIIISSDRLRELFTYTPKDVAELLACLEKESDPYGLMNDIRKHYTDDPEDLDKSDVVTKILYFVDSAYKLGYLKATCEISALNNTIINNLTGR